MPSVYSFLLLCFVLVVVLATNKYRGTNKYFKNAFLFTLPFVRSYFVVIVFFIFCIFVFTLIMKFMFGTLFSLLWLFCCCLCYMLLLWFLLKVLCSALESKATTTTIKYLWNLPEQQLYLPFIFAESVVLYKWSRVLRYMIIKVEPDFETEL